MEVRPYFNHRLDELREIFKANQTNISVLKDLLTELKSRKKNKNLPFFIKEVQDSVVALVKESNQSSNSRKKQSKNSEYPVELMSIDIISDKSSKTIFEIVPRDWDSEQRRVIDLEEASHNIVEAGPGSGKTAVACARVAHLIEQCGLDASKIFLISFTRTAIKELRDRIEAFAEKPLNISGLQILTLDSFTWQMLKGYGDGDAKKLFGSYEHNIDNFVQKLQDLDGQVLEYLDELQHVVIDEGQDLVGERARLVIEIIRNLNDDCGVTLFADSAQAIYGFTDDSEQHDTHSGLTVVERINQGEIEGFQTILLKNIHRTDDIKLRMLFSTGRKRLLGKKESSIADWKEMKGIIKECAHEEINQINPEDLKDKMNSLLLFRTRAEVLQQSSFLWSKRVPHKLRMSGIPQRVHPWIGRVFSEFEGDFITLQQFEELWDQKVGMPNRQEAWLLLFENLRDKQGRIKLTRLRELLSRDRPPVDFLVDEKILPGPVVGTIHASKGREADRVYLMLPPDTFIDTGDERYKLNPYEIAEEERVLFVGATRAKQKLGVGKGSQLYSTKFEGRRTFRKPKNGINRRQIEIGLNGDIDFVSIASKGFSKDPKVLQEWFWTNSASYVELEARYDYDLQSVVLYSQEEIPLALALLSSRFANDLWGIAKMVADKDGAGSLKPSNKITHIHMVGVTTVVIPDSQRDSLASPWRHSGFLLAPVITGFPTVYFNHWNKN